MTAAQILETARAVGIEIQLDAGDLLLKAASKPPAEMLDVLLRHKAEIVALLRPGQDGWSAEDWQVFFDERAGIAEFDGGLSPLEAEANAFACCVAEWLNRNPVPSSPGQCDGCAGGGHRGGTGSKGHRSAGRLGGVLGHDDGGTATARSTSTTSATNHP
jgi:hypothetical protein